MHRRRVRRGRTERGAALVEFALILPVFVVLIFGMITGGLAVSQQNSVKNAVREATRYAAVTTAGTTSATIQDPFLKGVIEQTEFASNGDLADSVDAKQICAAYYDGSAWYRRTKTSSGVTTGSSPCIAADGATGKRVQIVAQRRTEIGAIFFTIPVSLSGQSVSRYEL